MRRQFTHAEIDASNAADDWKIAARLRRDGRLLTMARQNLKRWMTRDGRNVRPVFHEWHHLLTRLSRLEIADFLQSNSAMARRLRQSSPFMGPLSQTPPRTRKRHAKARA